MRIIFMGTPDFAVPTLMALHESEHQIVAVVTSVDTPSGRGLKFQSSAVKIKAEELGYPIFQPDKLDSLEFLKSVEDCFVDIFVVVAFKILPEKLFSIPRLGSVNIHPSLLPKYRGAAPIHRAILNGDNETGITIFQIGNKVDAGNILLQKKYRINRNDTTGDLWDKFASEGAKLLIESLGKIESSDTKPITQDKSKITKAPKINKSECEIDWLNSSEYIHNQIRAFTPFPGAYTFYKKKRIKLYDSELCKTKQSPISLNMGEILIKDDKLFIGTKKSAIQINSVQVEGKRKLHVKDFIKGNHVQIGEYFGR
jgi:methionyl-tRNA formyltransferase